MPITPLPVFEADANPHHRTALSDQEIYDRLEAPKSIVVKFGSMKLVGEFPYDGDAKPGCGSKLVIRTHRGTEVGEMLTSTCPNAGCSKSVTRKEMLDYIDNSGGKEYPFHTDGKILRVATIDDLNAQSALDTIRQEAVKVCKAEIISLNLKMKLVEAEPILGGELLTFYYMSEERVDFRELVRNLAGYFKTRIEMRQVGARDEARLVADYERCGQYCCCKNFLKVLTPVSMSAAKRQKATLEPLKISGRCGRLMCCLRYEDQTYKDLKAALPRRNARVGTAEGPGVVIDSKVLVQLVLVRLDFEGKEIAVPVEELMDPDNCPPPGTSPTPPAAQAEPDTFRGLAEEEVVERTDDRKRRQRTRHQQQERYRKQSQDYDAQQDEVSSARDGDEIDREPAMVDFDAPIDPGRGDGDTTETTETGDGDETERGDRSRRGGRRKRGGRGRRGGKRNRRDGGGGGAPSGGDQSAQSTGESPQANRGNGGQPSSESGGDDNDHSGGSQRRRRRGGRRRGRRGGSGRGGGGGNPSDGGSDSPSESG